ncbi:MAG: MsnO8 family LLM class oxidoreductase [Hyalangium sp.]|uniref:MsnO8 family LLM class oxidoreductase n=1 Tax=Hyalangium sp. TaxID=2028555 RepID=UPI00389A372D
MRLGILDFCLIRPGLEPYHSLYESVRVAQELEQLGYSRFWMAEHHELLYAQHVPDLMVPLIAGSTESIRIGVAGMLMKLHSPMRVAKAFRMLEAMFPGRIDLGVGGGEAEPPVIEAMRAPSAPEPIEKVREGYSQRVLQLLSLVRGESPLAFNPLGTPPPPFWMLGLSNPGSARTAAQHGTCYGFSLAHVQSRDNPAITSIYLDEFRPNAHQPKPEMIVAVSGLCAETEEEARKLALTGIGSMDPALMVVGNPEQCREKLETLAHRYRADEIIFLDVAPDEASRLRGYRLLASALRLGTASTEARKTA